MVFFNLYSVERLFFLESKYLNNYCQKGAVTLPFLSPPPPPREGCCTLTSSVCVYVSCACTLLPSLPLPPVSLTYPSALSSVSAPRNPPLGNCHSPSSPTGSPCLSAPASVTVLIPPPPHSRSDFCESLSCPYSFSVMTPECPERIGRQTAASSLGQFISRAEFLIHYDGHLRKQGSGGWGVRCLVSVGFRWFWFS